MDTSYHFIREKILVRNFLLSYVSTIRMTVYILTNPLPQTYALYVQVTNAFDSPNSSYR